MFALERSNGRRLAVGVVCMLGLRMGDKVDSEGHMSASCAHVLHPWYQS